MYHHHCHELLLLHHLCHVYLLLPHLWLHLISLKFHHCLYFFPTKFDLISLLPSFSLMLYCHHTHNMLQSLLLSWCSVLSFYWEMGIAKPLDITFVCNEEATLNEWPVSNTALLHILFFVLALWSWLLMDKTLKITINQWLHFAKILQSALIFSPLFSNSVLSGPLSIHSIFQLSFLSSLLPWVILADTSKNKMIFAMYIEQVIRITSLSFLPHDVIQFSLYTFSILIKFWKSGEMALSSQPPIRHSNRKIGSGFSTSSSRPLQDFGGVKML